MTEQNLQKVKIDGFTKQESEPSSVVFDKKLEEKREDAIAKNLLKADGVAVIILGGGHDLSENIKRAGGSCQHERVAV